MAHLEETAPRVRELVAGLAHEQLSFKPAPEMFSMREHVLHLRDIDLEGYEKRVQLALSQELPSYPDVDGARLAVERRYNEQELQPGLEALERSRRNTLDLLLASSEDAFERRGVMEGMGSITLHRLLELWLDHDREHIAEMEGLRSVLDSRAEILV